MTDFNDTPEAEVVVAEEAPIEVEVVLEEEAVAEPAPVEAPVAEVVAEEVKPAKKAKAVSDDKVSTLTYKCGDAGRDIKSVQEYLISVGISCPSTAIFCTHTRDAVKKFQASVGSEPTGVIGHEILSLI